MTTEVLEGSGTEAVAGMSGTEIYRREILSQVPRLVGMLDRRPFSRSRGSFDRTWWGWKFRDFPVTMLQTAVRSVAELWRRPMPGNPLHQNDEVFTWICAAVETTCARQHADGSYDSVAPNSRDHGVTLAMVHALAEAMRHLGPDAPPRLSERVRRTVRAACRFAFDTDEHYAFITNHQALFALAWLDAHELLDETAYRMRAEDVIAGILRHQSSEGWYREYDGPDPGYETLGISYLAKYWERTASAAVLDSLARSVAFLAHCIHPDGTLGGVYGSRHTGLYYPGGMERLASDVPQARAIADHMIQSLLAGRVPGPACVDEPNLPPVMASYLEALDARSRRRPGPQPPDLPCTEMRGIRLFPEAGFVIAGLPAYYAITNLRKGGVCRVFDRSTGQLSFEQAGYLVRAGQRLWTSQVPDPDHGSAAAEGAAVRCTQRLAEVRQVLPSPLNVMLLRVLNLTVFRSAAARRWMMGLIIRRLITGRRGGALRLERRIVFDDTEIHFEDRLTMDRRRRIDEVASPRDFMAIHMGSAHYFDSSALRPVPEVPVATMARDLTLHGSAESRFTIAVTSEKA